MGFKRRYYCQTCGAKLISRPKHAKYCKDCYKKRKKEQIKEYGKEYRQRPEVMARKIKYDKEYNKEHRKKLETRTKEMKKK